MNNIRKFDIISDLLHTHYVIDDVSLMHHPEEKTSKFMSGILFYFYDTMFLFW